MKLFASTSNLHSPNTMGLLSFTFYGCLMRVLLTRTWCALDQYCEVCLSYCRGYYTCLHRSQLHAAGPYLLALGVRITWQTCFVPPTHWLASKTSVMVSALKCWQAVKHFYNHSLTRVTLSLLLSPVTTSALTSALHIACDTWVLLTP